MGTVLTFIRGVLKILPLTPIMYYVRSDIMMWIIDVSITYVYGSSFFEIPDKLMIEEDENIYVDLKQLCDALEDRHNGFLVS